MTRALGHVNLSLSSVRMLCSVYFYYVFIFIFCYVFYFAVTIAVSSDSPICSAVKVNLLLIPSSEFFNLDAVNFIFGITIQVFLIFFMSLLMNI